LPHAVNRTYSRRVEGTAVLGEELEVTSEFAIDSLGFLAESSLAVDDKTIDQFGIPSQPISRLPVGVERALVEKRWPETHESMIDPEAAGRSQ
jgi:hypothetical protein